MRKTLFQGYEGKEVRSWAVVPKLRISRTPENVLLRPYTMVRTLQFPQVIGGCEGVAN